MKGELWSVVWRLLYWLWIATELYVAVVTRTRRGAGNVQDRGSLLVLWVVIAASVTAGSWFGEVHPRTIFGGARWVRHLSVPLLATGLVIRWSAILSLGRAFSANVAILRSQTIYRQGLYRVVRHPSSSGLLLILAGVGVRPGNWGGLAIVLVPSIAALLYRIHVEEAALLMAFGPVYAAYSRSSRRLIPGVY